MQNLEAGANKSKILVVLLGHENSTSGVLSDVAVSRCELAIELLNTYPNAVVIPTGAYGKHFNKTKKMHFNYLRDYLIGHGIATNRILKGTISSNTIEDCLCVRKVAIDGDYSSLFLVTSDYHADRVEFILGHIFNNLQFTIVKAKTPQACIDVEGKKENRSFNLLMRNWIRPPLYVKGDKFPNLLYESAAQDQRHYDTVSLAVVTGAVIISGIIFQSGITLSTDAIKVAIYLFGIHINVLLMIIYERCSTTARTARRLMRLTEFAYESYGFSSGYEPHSLFHLMPSIQRTVRYLFLTLILINMMLLVITYKDLTA